MTTFLALYRGDSVGGSKLIALSAEPSIVADFAERMLSKPEGQGADAVLRELELGRRRALRVVRSEADE